MSESEAKKLSWWSYTDREGIKRYVELVEPNEPLTFMEGIGWVLHDEAKRITEAEYKENKKPEKLTKDDLFI